MKAAHFDTIDDETMQEIRKLFDARSKKTLARPTPRREFTGPVFHVDLVHEFVLVGAKRAGDNEGEAVICTIRKGNMAPGLWDEIEEGTVLDFNLDVDMRGRAARLSAAQGADSAARR